MGTNLVGKEETLQRFGLKRRGGRRESHMYERSGSNDRAMAMHRCQACDIRSAIGVAASIRRISEEMTILDDPVEWFARLVLMELLVDGKDSLDFLYSSMVD
jgi:hypothetical protein